MLAKEKKNQMECHIPSQTVKNHRNLNEYNNHSTKKNRQRFAKNTKSCESEK